MNFRGSWRHVCPSEVGNLGIRRKPWICWAKESSTFKSGVPLAPEELREVDHLYRGRHIRGYLASFTFGATTYLCLVQSCWD